MTRYDAPRGPAFAVATTFVRGDEGKVVRPAIARVRACHATEIAKSYTLCKLLKAGDEDS